MKKNFLLILVLNGLTAFAQNARLDSMLTVLATSKDDTSKIQLLDEISHEYSKVNLDKAKEYALLEIETARKIGHKKLESLGLDALANAYHNMGEFDLALENYVKALKIKEEGGYRKSIFTSLHNIASIYVQQKDYDKAIEYQLKSIKEIENKDLPEERAASYSLLGTIYHRKKEYKLSNEYHEKAIEIAKTLSDKNTVADLYNNWAGTLREIGDYKKSLAICNEVYKIHESALDTNSMASVLGNIGSLYTDLQNYDSALICTKQSIAYSAMAGDNENRLNGYVNMVNIYDALKDYKGEVDYLNRYISLKDSIFNKYRAMAMADMQTKYETEKKEAENLALVQQNEIQSLKISNNYYVIISLAALFAVGIIVSMLLFSRNKLRFQQRTSQLEQRLLRSQMNPHFIFNSLQAIQNFIDDKKAIKYLSSFGALTRSILENSRLESIPLSKEIKLLENYLELQQLLHEQQFKYVINVAPDLDPQDIDIPPMLSQPFIENAVEYGMRDVETGGLIEINFSTKGDMLFLEIRDNGNGFTVEKDKKHMSLATVITKERISLFNKKRSSKASFNISEAFPGATRKGVAVNFAIPI